jgi:hypothetical protein
MEAVGEQDHGLTLRPPAGDHRKQLLLHGEADRALGLFNPPSERQGALTPAHTQHQDVVAIRGLGLIEKQRDGLPGFAQPGQDLAGERFHNRVAAYQIIG